MDIGFLSSSSSWYVIHSILLQMEFYFLIVQIEPNDNIDFSVINSSTRVVVIPEYREQSKIIQSEQPVSLPSDTQIEPSKSLKTLVRSIGTLVCSSLPNTSTVPDKKLKSKLALVPGRHRRLYRVEIDETTSINPTIARINRSDWSSNEDDGTGWPDVFVAKVTVYRSHKEVNKKNKRDFFKILIFFRLNHQNLRIQVYQNIFQIYIFY